MLAAPSGPLRTPYYETPPDAPARVRLYHGDCLELLPLVAPPERRLFVHADPPYGVAEQTDRAARARGRTHGAPSPRVLSKLPKGGRAAIRRHDWPAIAGDDAPYDPAPLLAYIEAGVRTIIWGWNHFAPLLPPTRAPIIWNKRAGTVQDDNADAELAWTNLPGVARVFAHTWRGVCRASETGTEHLAPSQKPRAYCDWLWSGRGRGRPLVAQGDVIVVPYLGSGPEVEAALDWGFDGIGMDVDARWLDVTIEKRIKPALARARVSFEARMAHARRSVDEQLALWGAEKIDNGS